MRSEKGKKKKEEEEGNKARLWWTGQKIMIKYNAKEVNAVSVALTMCVCERDTWITSAIITPFLFFTVTFNIS